ncbi:MAG: proprotein convertase P-domain-containing protein, partial [Thermoanaerobaculia bacterium]|nr:proprotein convertase P-domain-containing protein [Thermoanaerobaculia bacterium]
MFPLRVLCTRFKTGTSKTGRILATSLLAAAALTQGAAAHVYQFDNTTGAAIPTLSAGGGGTAVYSQSGLNLAIADNTYNGSQASMTCTTMVIAPEPGFNAINGPVTVTIAMSHTYVGDLVIKLFRTSPAGDNFTLVSRPGVSESADNGNDANGWGDTSNLAIGFPLTYAASATTESEDMGAGLGDDTTICQSGGSPCTYNPNNGASLQSEDLADLNGDNKGGSWSLCIGDAGPGDTGTLAGWSINFGSVGPPDPSDANCDAGTGSLSVTFGVSDTFTATSLAVGLNASHANRGDIRASLAAPDGTVYPLITQSGDTDDNYDIYLIANTDSGSDNVGLLDDNDSDPAATAPYFNRLVNGISGLDGVSESANGTWTLRLCDRTDNSVTGTFNRARLALVDSAASAQVCTSRLTYNWGANGQNANFTSFTVGGITVTETAALNYLGAGANNFTTSTESDGGQAGFYRLYMAPESIDGDPLDYEDMGQLVTFSFSETVQDLEFSLTDNDWANSDFEDILRVEGTGPLAGYARYTRSAASGTPSFSFAGDILEGDTENVNTTNGGTSTYFFDRGLNTASVIYLSGNEVAGTGEPNDQLVTITDFQFCAFDFGDAPDTYGTLLNNGAHHILGRRLVHLGANAPDGEIDGQTGGGVATADDGAGVGSINDEDGTE